MTGGEPNGGEVRAITYCFVPHDLAAKLHEPLRKHFADEPGVEVVVEQRARDRRSASDRRVSGAETAAERRLIRGVHGRRAGDRRADLVAVPAPDGPLPRRARPYLERLAWAERLEPTGERLEDLDTARLVARFQSGERDVYSVLYMRYFDRVFSYLKTLFRDDPHEAEDLTQQVFLNVLDALPRYERREQPFRAWLFVIVRNAGLMQLRKSSRIELAEPGTAQLEASHEDGDEVALDWITDRELLMFVERLPEPQRQVLLLRFMLGLRPTEIAQVLDRSPDDVRQLQSRALRFLRARLEALGRHGTRGHQVRIRRRPRQAWVLRTRRFSLL
jgi:RNA polymerase sigma-70 factor (ECF subfamily)